MSRPRQMHLGLFILGTGSHVAGWRWPGALTDFTDLAAIRRIAETAERGRFDLIFMGDNLRRCGLHRPTRCGSSRSP